MKDQIVSEDRSEKIKFWTRTCNTEDLRLEHVTQRLSAGYQSKLGGSRTRVDPPIRISQEQASRTNK